jgi:hypothetical protein
MSPLAKARSEGQAITAVSDAAAKVAVANSTSFFFKLKTDSASAATSETICESSISSGNVIIRGRGYRKIVFPATGFPLRVPPISYGP